MLSWQGFLDFFGGHKRKYERCSENFARCQKRLTDLNMELAKADDRIKQLEKSLHGPASSEEH